MAKRDEGALKAAIWTRELEKIELRPRDESVDCNVCGQPTKERQRASI